MVHLFTDDASHREYYKDRFYEEVANDCLKFGPLGDEERRSGASMRDICPPWQRETETVHVVVEFLCMALCDECRFTTGTYVTELIKAMSVRLNPESMIWQQDKTIGDYDIVNEVYDQPLEQELSAFMKFGIVDLIQTIEEKANNEEKRMVIGFLQKKHMDEIHEWLLELLLTRKGEKTSARTMTMWLTSNCRVAQLNFTRVNDFRSKVAYRGWLHQLMNGAMQRHYEKEKIQYVVDYDPEKDIIDIKPEKIEDERERDGVAEVDGNTEMDTSPEIRERDGLAEDGGNTEMDVSPEI